MIQNFEYTSSHIDEYLEQENLFNVFDEDDLKTILKSAKLTPNSYNSLLKQGNNAIGATKLYKCARNVIVNMNDYQDAVSVLDLMKRYLKIQLLDNVIEILNQHDKHYQDLLNSVLQQNETNLQKISKLEQANERLLKEIEEKEAEKSLTSNQEKKILSKINEFKASDDFESIYAFFDDLSKQNNNKMIKKACDEGLLDKNGQKDRNILQQSAFRGNVGLVKSLIQSGCDKESRTVKGNSLLFLASMKGHLELAKYLVSIGANIESKNNIGDTPLISASINNEVELVKYLISAGANIETKNNKGSTALIRASGYNRIQVVQYLVSVGANIEAKTVEGNTALLWASIEGNIEVVKYLISIGANKEITNNNGSTPLSSAKKYGHNDIVNYLQTI